MGIKTIPMENRFKKQNGCWEALLIAVKEKKRRAKEKTKDISISMQSFKEARRDKKAFLRDQCKETEENNSMERLDISSRKLEISREYFMQRWAR